MYSRAVDHVVRETELGQIAVSTHAIAQIVGHVLAEITAGVRERSHTRWSR